MRPLRVLAIATGLAALLSQAGEAQGGRQFKDSWFWGVKGGGLMYSSETTTSGGAPLVGGDWLITRSQGGLYVGFDQSFFSTTGGFLDRHPDSSDVFVRPVTLKNLRRFTMAGMIFPVQSMRFNPYAGFGLSLNQVAGAVLAAGTSEGRLLIAADSIQARKAAFTPILILGTQYRLSPLSLFVQGTGSPTQQGFFLSNKGSARAVSLSMEAGVRYNIGSSIDRGR